MLRYPCPFLGDEMQVTDKALKAPPPIVKMKKVQIWGKEQPGKVTFANSDKRLIVEMTTPPSPHVDCVDVNIGPDAKMDELASVIAELWGNCIYLNELLKRA